MREFSVRSLLWAAAFYVPLALLLDWFLRRSAPTGRPWLTLSDEGIDSPHFWGKEKAFRWRDIESIRTSLDRGYTVITLHLRPSVGLPDKRLFFSGLNPSRPKLMFNAFNHEEQESVIEAIRARLRRARERGVSVATFQDGTAEHRSFEKTVEKLGTMPLATYGLIAVNVVVWLAALASGASLERTPAELLLNWGGNAASETQRGEWWRLLSAAFLHGNALHLMMNMFGLYSLGSMIERLYGPRLLVLVYVGTALTGNAASLHFAAQHAVSVGASSAVFGLLGLYLGAVVMHRKHMPKGFTKQTLTGVGIFVLYSVAHGLGTSGIDNAAHIGGFLGGCLLAALLPIRLDKDRFDRTWASRAASAALVLLAVTAVTVIAAPKATLDQRAVIASEQRFSEVTRRMKLAAMTVQREANQAKTGVKSAKEVDQRGRTVHASVFRQLREELATVQLRPGHPLQWMLDDSRRAIDLTIEGLEMESTFEEDGSEPVPVDPERFAQIEAELKVINDRVKEKAEALKRPR